MVTLPVPHTEVERIYTDLADEIAVLEERLSDDLPVETTAGLPDHLHDAVNNWEVGRKSLRTVPACNVYARHYNTPVPDAVKRTLTGLDATINVFDDIIDTRNLTTQSKIALTVNAAFSSVLMVESAPPEANAEINEILLDYFTTVFQIPLVEGDLFERMTDATSPEERRAAAEEFYDPAAEERLLEDLRTYRGRRLLFKDIRDVERDLADGDTTPIIYFLRTCDETEEVVDVVKTLYNRFTYSDAGLLSYGDVLEELEDRPTDLYSAIRQTQQALLEPVV
ncbi:MAG: hypothetical protein ABEI76_01220 [Halobacteriales archaeon]